MGFWIGFVVGIVATLVFSALFAKPLMMWFLKRKANKIVDNVQEKINAIGKQFEEKRQEVEPENAGIQ